MRFKAFFLYIGLGAAFLAVSLWVFLSGGKNAKALRAKYKLGGMMLSAWAMLSAASCAGPGPIVSCYEPAEPPRNEGGEEVMCYDVAEEQDIVHLNGTAFSRGQEVEISIERPSWETYVVQILNNQDKDEVLQEERFPLPADARPNPFSFHFTFDEQLPVGQVILAVKAAYIYDDEEKVINIWSTPITLE